MSNWIEEHLRQIAKEEMQRKEKEAGAKEALEKENALKALAKNTEDQRKEAVISAIKAELQSIIQRFNIETLLMDIKKELMKGAFLKKGQSIIYSDSDSFIGFGLIKTSEKNQEVSGGGEFQAEPGGSVEGGYVAGPKFYVDPYSYTVTTRNSEGILAGTIYLAKTREYKLYCSRCRSGEEYKFYPPDFPKGWLRKKQRHGGETYRKVQWGKFSQDYDWKAVQEIPDIEAEEHHISPLYEFGKTGLMLFDASGNNNEAFKKQLVLLGK